MNYKITALIFLFIALSSCKKKNTDHTLEGYIYKNCTKVPFVNLHLSVEGINYRPLQAAEYTYLGEFTTDENGYYSLMYETEKTYDGLQYILKNSQFIRTGFEKKMKLVHYESAVVSHNVILKVDDTLGQHDTLYMEALMNPTILLGTGPFKDGQIIPIQIRPNIGTAQSLFIEGDRVGKGLFWWGLGKEGINRPTQGHTGDPQTIRGTLQPVCGQGEDIVIDLRGIRGG